MASRADARHDMGDKDTKGNSFPIRFQIGFIQATTNPSPRLDSQRITINGNGVMLSLLFSIHFGYTARRGRESNNWAWTLGDRQYRWLKASLENTDAKFRFVSYTISSGAPNKQPRGSRSCSVLGMGRKRRISEDEFAKNRPGWEAPIHELLRQHGVSVVFHGHDHLFIKQDLDGIVYQLVPQPGHARMVQHQQCQRIWITFRGNTIEFRTHSRPHHRRISTPRYVRAISQTMKTRTVEMAR